MLVNLIKEEGGGQEPDCRNALRPHHDASQAHNLAHAAVGLLCNMLGCHLRYATCWGYNIISTHHYSVATSESGGRKTKQPFVKVSCEYRSEDQPQKFEGTTSQKAMWGESGS